MHTQGLAVTQALGLIPKMPYEPQQKKRKININKEDEREIEL